MKWELFSKKKPTTNGRYLVSYSHGDFRAILYKDGVWLGDPDRFGYHEFVDPVWWAEVKTPRESLY